MKKLSFGEHKNIIGGTVKRIRCEKKLSQYDLASKMQLLEVNIDQQMISKIEKNQRLVTDYELVCFCHALDMDISDMLKEFYQSHTFEQ